MKKLIATALAGVMAVSTVVLPASAQGVSSAVVPAVSTSTDVSAYLHEAGWRDRRHYRGHRHSRHRHRHYRHRDHDDFDGGAALAAGIFGLAAGAIIAGSQNGSGDWHAYCASKYRSYDRRSGTYMGYDGHRHACR